MTSTPLDAMAEFFDARFYRETYPDITRDIDPVVHYCTIGWREGRDPNTWFSTRLYEIGNLDVACSKINPFFHYIAVGRSEGRRIWPHVARRDIPHLPPEAHLLEGEFDPAFYCARNPDVPSDGTDPLVHFHNIGWKEGRDPAPCFATRHYLTQHDDVARAGVNPFLHYVLVGREDGRAVRPAPPLMRGDMDHVHVDRRGVLHVVGWQFPPAERIDILLDGQPFGVAQANFPRPDVQKAHAGSPANSGFRFRGDCDLTGEHIVTARIVGPNGARLELSRTAIAGQPARSARAATPAVIGAQSPAQDFRVEIDEPPIVNGMAGPITRRLTVSGWAVAKVGVAGVDILLDGNRIGEAQIGLVRQDVGAAVPEWPDALRSGFAFHCPSRALTDGAHEVTLRIRAKDGASFRRCFTVTVEKDATEVKSGLRTRLARAAVELAEAVLARQGGAPAIQVFLHVPSSASPDQVRLSLASLAGQVYRNWTLVVVLGAAQRPVAARLLGMVPDLAARTVLCERARARCDPRAGCVGFLVAGDRYACDALLEFALAARLTPAEFTYADDFRIGASSDRLESFCKPDFSPDLLLSTNYIGHAWVASPELLSRARITPHNLFARGGYDAVLRLTEHAQTILHLPKRLVEMAAQPFDPEAERAALSRAARRRGIAAEIRAGRAAATWRLRRTAKPAGKVSIIIPTCAAKGHIKTCLESLRSNTAYRDFEIICVENIPASQPEWQGWVRAHADKVLTMTEPFNWSRYNNHAVDLANGEYLLFLNDDVEISQPDWLEAMLEHAQRPEVAAVGPQLLYPNGKVQHAGMFLAESGTGRHAFRFAEQDDPGYFGLALTQRNVIAVTGACMLVQREIFEALGRFDESHDIINNDLDFCLRAHEAGKLVVFTPFATLVHHELASREQLPDRCDTAYFQRRWGLLFAAGDPYFSPLLSRHSDGYDPDEEPVEEVHVGRLFRSGDIQRILVVKLDHIGDFITAIPAIRHLRHLFPSASLSLLASPAVCALAASESLFEEMIEFQFFHSRSELGPLPLTESDLRALQERLVPYRFDLAIDLRKHPDTRAVLRHTGARFLAGFDHQGQHGFLDLALEWEGNRHLERKRSHIASDLVNLVSLIGAAGVDLTGDPAIAVRSGSPEFIPEDARTLFDKPVVAVHPGVGTIVRQWPAEHFAALIDLLVAHCGVNAVLIGAPEDQPIGEAILGKLAHRQAAASLMGRVPLRHLPALLTSCSLYVGNDSGPKHIAARLGIPTLGIHSGVVDVMEWGPLGRNAVAVRKDVRCAPCYLARPEDCPRELACLHELQPNRVLASARLLLQLASRQE